MRFTETRLSGAYVIDPERNEDDRGFFARVFCEHEFAERRLDARFVQCSVSFNRRRGTLRGLHFQVAPYEEAKLVRCTHGRVYDVIVDLRSQSPTFRRWESVVLSSERRNALYIPKGFAQGFQTLDDDVELFYQMSQFYHPESARTLRWNDPALGVEWPISTAILSGRDAAAPLLGEIEGS